MKNKLLFLLQEVHNQYAGKAVDYEESEKYEKMQDMFDVTDKIEDTISFIKELKISNK